jgi:hypothetical protein
MVRIFRLCCLSLFLSFSSALFSAGPMFHLWVAEKFCEIHNIDDIEVVKEIIIGTEFPDIRYIIPIPRASTHARISDIREVYQSKTPFECGMKIHAWLDIVRESLVDKSIYAAVVSYSEGQSPTFIKLIEDEMLADFYDGQRWAFCFDRVLEEELAYTTEEAICKWHKFIQLNLSFRSSWLLWAQSYRGPAFGVSKKTLYDWSFVLPELKDSLIFRKHLYALLGHIERELQRYAEFSKINFSS